MHGEHAGPVADGDLLGDRRRGGGWSVSLEVQVSRSRNGLDHDLGSVGSSAPGAHLLEHRHRSEHCHVRAGRRGPRGPAPRHRRGGTSRTTCRGCNPRARARRRAPRVARAGRDREQVERGACPRARSPTAWARRTSKVSAGSEEGAGFGAGGDGGLEIQGVGDVESGVEVHGAGEGQGLVVQGDVAFCPTTPGRAARPPPA